ncbi:MAG TPA: DUF2809 domain-containing protein [Hyphomonadaceae bacterium]|jgi:hypothetical protein|nr:DUF2809 domain-containing protein [Hyphomonadaceae bacterium]
MKFRPGYGLAALVVFAVEVCIALFVHDGLIRPYIGDVLAVVLVYCALRAVTPMPLWPAIAVTLSIALAIELAQLLNLLDALGLRSNRIAATVLGGSFDWLDLVAYAAGAFAVVAVELTRLRR